MRRIEVEFKVTEIGKIRFGDKKMLNYYSEKSKFQKNSIAWEIKTNVFPTLFCTIIANQTPEFVFQTFTFVTQQ